MGMQSLDGLLEMVREEALTCGTVTGVPAFTSCQLTVWFGNFGVCAWNSRVTTEDTPETDWNHNLKLTEIKTGTGGP